jgi:hypothetical protein
VDEAWGTLFPLAATGLGLAAVVTLGLSMLSVLGGRPPAELFSGLRHFVRGTVGLILGTRLYLTLIEVCNSLSARLLDPAGGLPGLEHMTAAGQLVAYPVVALVYLLFATVFFFTRAKVVFTCVACLVLAPVAFVLGALPFKKAQDVYDVWLTYAVASAFVQVVQAVLLGIGANVLTHGTSAAQVTPGVLGAGIVGVVSVFAAGTAPTMILGALLHRGLVPAGTLSTAAHLALGLALPVLWRSGGVPPVPPRVYPPPAPPPDPGRALAGGGGPALAGTGGGAPRLIEYVPPMLPPPR